MVEEGDGPRRPPAGGMGGMGQRRRGGRVGALGEGEAEQEEGGVVRGSNFDLVWGGGEIRDLGGGGGGNSHFARQNKFFGWSGSISERSGSSYLFLVFTVIQWAN